jgi:hypothetical protein
MLKRLILGLALLGALGGAVLATAAPASACGDSLHTS